MGSVTLPENPRDQPGFKDTGVGSGDIPKSLKRKKFYLKFQEFLEKKLKEKNKS